MDYIYVTSRNAYTTESFVKKIAIEQFNYLNPIIERNAHGKPYFKEHIEQPTLHFSVSHTNDKLFVVFSKDKIGLDVENTNRQVDYAKLLPRIDNKQFVNSSYEFLRLWTAKESVVKYLGETMATDAKYIDFSPDFAHTKYKQVPLPVHIQHLSLENFLIAVCSEYPTEYSFHEII